MVAEEKKSGSFEQDQSINWPQAQPFILPSINAHKLKILKDCVQSTHYDLIAKFPLGDKNYDLALDALNKVYSWQMNTQK